MPFVELNGYTVPATNGRTIRRISKLGKRTRAFRTMIRDAQRGRRRAWAMDIVHQRLEDADPTAELVHGAGHHVDFADGLNASTGLNPLPGYAVGILRAGVWGVFGKGVFTLAAALTGIVGRWDAQHVRDDDWTVIWWQYPRPGGTKRWNGYAKRSDGLGYLNGIQDDTVGEPGAAGGLFPRFVDGVLELVKDGGNLINLDDMVVLPYKASASQLAAWTTEANGKFGPCPVVRMTGSIVDGETVHVLGNVTGTRFVQFSENIKGVGWVNNAKVISVELIEVDEAFLKGVLNQGIATPVPPGDPLWWYDGQDMDGQLNASLSQGNEIATWADKGGRGQDATQATEALRPTFQQFAEKTKLGFSSAALFDTGAGQYLQTLDDAGQDNPLVAAVLFRKLDATVGVFHVVDGIASGGALNLRYSGFGGEPFIQQGATVQHPTELLVSGEWSLSIARYDGSSSTWRLNGVDGAVDPGAVGSVEGITLGKDRNLSLGTHNGELVEVVIWGDTSYGTLDAIAKYFTDKYGALPQT